MPCDAGIDGSLVFSGASASASRSRRRLLGDFSKNTGRCFVIDFRAPADFSHSRAVPGAASRREILSGPSFRLRCISVTSLPPLLCLGKSAGRLLTGHISRGHGYEESRYQFELRYYGFHISFRAVMLILGIALFMICHGKHIIPLSAIHSCQHTVPGY